MSGVPTSSRQHVASRAWFWVWALVGVGAALGAVSLGPLLLVPTAAVAALLLSKPTIRRSAYGLVSGVGAILLYIAYVQRAGPGNHVLAQGGQQAGAIRTSIRSRGSCSESLA